MVGGAYLSLHRGQKNEGSAVPEQSLTIASYSAPENSIDELDSDLDGLPDWKELILGTDTKNPDTDGDGTNDGDEVKQDRNP